MTIKIEQEALLRVLDRQHPSSSHPPLEAAISTADEGFVLVDLGKPPLGSDLAVDKLRSPTDDDDTLSTTSLSSSDSECEIERRVSFADTLVSEEWTRPYTPKEEISSLYYSTDETSRFRQEYRLERKLLSELSVDPENFSVDEKDLAALVTATPNNQAYRISRVVVLHNDKLETFVDEEKENIDDFFDNDSFWSGSITWY